MHGIFQVLLHLQQDKPMIATLHNVLVGLLNDLFKRFLLPSATRTNLEKVWIFVHIAITFYTLS
jgi:hypothetical protein